MAKEGSDNEENQRIPDERELLSIAQHIEGNLEILGEFLGIQRTRIDDIKLKSPTTTLRIYRMLLEWRNINGDDATVEKLFSMMLNAPSDVKINLVALKENYRLFGTIERSEYFVGKLVDAEVLEKGFQSILEGETLPVILANLTKKGTANSNNYAEKKIPGLNRRIVVKRINVKEEEAEQKMRSLRSEKLCARSVHFAIVPLYGIREDSENKIFYFLSPYMEMGSLNQVIEDDNKRLERKEMPVLHPGLRLKILFQIASAIDFLHTPLKDIRGIIIHGDVKSLNIVLDEAFNARLIDFGLAREMKEGHDHTKTTSKYMFTPGYGKETQQDILAKHDDYRYFGVVIRELLTGRKPSVEGCPEENLINQVPKRIEKRLLGMWKILKIKPPLSQSLVQLSTNCIKDKTLSSKEIVKTLKEVLKKANTPRWQNLSKGCKKCDMCLENDSVGGPILTHYNCQNNIKICVSCMRNSYCNPIHCHSCEKEADSVDTTIYPTIGHGWAALLIAGDDPRDSVAKTLKADVDAVFKVITSKCPLVMGVSVENVQIVNDVENVKKKMEDVVKALQNVDDIHTLLVYISSHYVPEKGGFELKSKPEKQFLSLSDLQEIIANILHEGEKKRTIVLLDCCSSPAITIAQTPVQDGENNPTNIEPPAEVGDTNASETSNKRAYKIDQELILKVPGIRIVQMNACKPNQNAVIEPDGSLFRKILLQSLTRNALDEPCVNFPKCQFCSLSGDFVTVEKMQGHIASHWVTSEKCDCVSYYHNVDHVDVKIGYVINFKVDLQVTYRYKDKVEHDRIPQRMFGELSELLIVLFDKYVEKMGLDLPADNELKLSTADFYEILCIEVEKGPKKHQRDRLSTLERVMAAWNAKRELVVTLRTLPEVTDGAVGKFLPSGQSVEPILDILQKEKSIKCLEEDYATAFVIKLIDEFKVFKSSWDKVEQNMEQRSPTIETFDDHLLDLEEALDKTDMSEKKLLKELQIVFPCANINGKRKHRRDFMCYKVVRREDG